MSVFSVLPLNAGAGVSETCYGGHMETDYWIAVEYF